MLRITPKRILPLSGADVADVTHVATQIWSDIKVNCVADHVSVEMDTRQSRDLLVRRLRALGFVVRTVDHWYLTVIGRDAAHPAVRALSESELDARIAYLTGLREAATTSTTNEP